MHSSPALKFYSPGPNTFVSSAKLFVSSTINAFVLEVGLETFQKRTETRGKVFLQNFFSSRDGPGKNCRNKTELEEHKKTTLHLLCLSFRCSVVFLHSFISVLFCTFFRSINTWNEVLGKSFPPVILRAFISALFLYFLQVHPYLKWSFSETFFPQELLYFWGGGGHVVNRLSHIVPVYLWIRYQQPYTSYAYAMTLSARLNSLQVGEEIMENSCWSSR